MYAIEGSGTYLSAHFIGSEHLESALEMLDRGDEDSIIRFFSISLEPRPQAYIDGRFLVGNFDFDRNIEVVTYTNLDGFYYHVIEFYPDSYFVDYELNIFPIFLFFILISPAVSVLIVIVWIFYVLTK